MKKHESKIIVKINISKIKWQQSLATKWKKLSKKNLLKPTQEDKDWMGFEDDIDDEWTW